MLDDAGDALVLAHPHDAAVAGGVVEPGGEDRAGGAGVAVLGHERGDGAGTQQRRVAGEHEHVDVVVDVVVVGQAGEADGDGVAGAALHVLLHELEAQPGAVLGELLGDALGAVAHHHDGPVDLRRRQRVEHVQHHRPPAEQVQGLGPRRPHPRALPAASTTADRCPLGHARQVYRFQPSAQRAAYDRQARRRAAKRLGVDVASTTST